MTDTKKKVDKNSPKMIKKIFFIKKFLKYRQSQEKTKIRFLCKKTQYFKVENLGVFSKDKKLSNEGRWNEEEHDKFLDGIIIFGTNWKKVKKLINTRTSVQVRSHAQKFFLKMKICKEEALGIDFTLDSILSIKDMINQIQSNGINYDIKSIFKYLNYKCDINKKPNKFLEARNKNINKNKDNNDTKILLDEEEEDKKMKNNELKIKQINGEYTNNIFINQITNQNNQINIFENTCFNMNLNQQNNNHFTFIFPNINPIINKPLLNINNFNNFYIGKNFCEPLDFLSLGQIKNNLNNPSFNNHLNDNKNQNFFNIIPFANDVSPLLTDNPVYLNYLLSRLLGSQIYK